MSDPDRCTTCWEPLDRGNVTCRVCGEDNSPDARGRDATELDGPDETDGEVEVPDFLDQLGDWSEVKHEIIERYAHAYTTILAKQKFKRIVYIDGFAGSGVALDRSGDLVAASPTRALEVRPSFTELHFIEQDARKVHELRRWIGHDTRVVIHQGDANNLLISRVLPRCRFEDYARGLCLLDPYGLTVDWHVLVTIGAMKSVEIFFNFMVVGANRNVLWKDPSRVPPKRLALMDRIWGDRSWLESAYQPTTDLFGTSSRKIGGNEALIQAYRRRLQKVAGFKFVPDPIPMKNSRNATVYYLFFASPNETANRIVNDIFRKFRPT